MDVYMALQYFCSNAQWQSQNTKSPLQLLENMNFYVNDIATQHAILTQNYGVTSASSTM